MQIVVDGEIDRIGFHFDVFEYEKAGPHSPPFPFFFFLSSMLFGFSLKILLLDSFLGLRKKRNTPETSFIQQEINTGVSVVCI
jgi:hypothetical protein